MIHLGSIRGTTITVDLSFLILVALFVASDYDPKAGIQHALLWAPVLFISVLIHELAHAAMIGAFGYGPSEIVLGGIGGATMNKRTAKSWHNVIISLAGPVSSFVLAWSIAILIHRVPFAHRDPMMIEFLPLLARANLWWGIFNLFPIAPLDGGHAVRSFLRIFLREGTAFTISTWIAIVVGVLVALAGLYFRFIFLTVLIAWYVFMNYQQWRHFREHGTPGD
ncbi:MAG TPA: site-2 protease family protein [Thermoanaerobaculia bacterium]|nr:site-2 protease family protein [Thermoanaerobaculia bacterium]